MNYSPLFSVITVCYNAEQSIEKTICSVLKQDIDLLEYIVIDGGSTDNTCDLVEKYRDKFGKRFTVISEKDNGIYDAMNKGIALSSGEYIIFTNSDDELCEGILSQISDFIHSLSEQADIIYGDTICSYRIDSKEVRKVRKAFESINLKSLCKGMGVSHQSMFTRAELFKKIGNFNNDFSIGGDWDFFIRAVKGGAMLKYLPVPISVFTTDGVSSKSHIMQRHAIRKKNQLYKTIDWFMIYDLLDFKTNIQMIIGSDNYNKIRYIHNNRGKKNVSDQ